MSSSSRRRGALLTSVDQQAALQVDWLERSDGGLYDWCGLFGREAVDARGDRRKGDALEADVVGELQGAGVGRSEEGFLSGGAITVLGPDGMNDVLRVDGEGRRNPCLAGWARCHLVAGALQVWARRPEDDATHATTSRQVFIRCIHDRADAERQGDEIADENFRLH